jgi:hypothetical protein
MSGTTGRIFISHASRDGQVADSLCAALEKRGLLCWISSRDVAGGDNYQESVFRAIRSARAMVLVFTANANRSDEIKKELALASQGKLIVIPLRMEDVAPSDAFAFELATRQWIDAFADWDRALQRLIIRINSVPERAPPSASEPAAFPQPRVFPPSSTDDATMIVSRASGVSGRLAGIQGGSVGAFGGAAGTFGGSAGLSDGSAASSDAEIARSRGSVAMPAGSIGTSGGSASAADRSTGASDRSVGALAEAAGATLAAAVALARTTPVPTILRAASGVLVAVLLLTWLLWPKSAPVVIPPPSPPPPVVQVPASRSLPTVAPPAEFRFETADETQIRDNVPIGLSLFRFSLNPQIVVLDFASLHDQGMMLNRVAALTEKAGLPRDRVLSDAELDSAIRAGGDTMETFYYGHDYSAAELARFFATADRDGIQLNPQEEMLRLILRQLRWFAPDVKAGLLSVPKVGANENVSFAAHSTILHNELAHGEYFSNPAYAAFVHQFWTTGLTPEERDNVRRFLGSEDYDTSINELVEDNMQAYLMFSHDPEFFTPAMVGMTAARLAEVQAAFLRSMPPGWLRDMLATSLLVQQLTPGQAR